MRVGTGWRRKAKQKSCWAAASLPSEEVTLPAQERGETHTRTNTSPHTNTHAAVVLFRFHGHWLSAAPWRKRHLLLDLCCQTRGPVGAFIYPNNRDLCTALRCVPPPQPQKESRQNWKAAIFACMKAYCGGGGLVQGGWMVEGRKRCGRGHAGGGGARKHTLESLLQVKMKEWKQLFPCCSCHSLSLGHLLKHCEIFSLFLRINNQTIIVIIIIIN